MKMLKATGSEMENLYSIIVARSEWLHQKGISQWNPAYPKHRFQTELGNGDVYYFRNEEGIIGTVTLLSSRPSYYPPDLWNDDKKSWYVCRLATSPVMSGNHYGSAILTLIESEAKKREVEVLRLDIVKANPFLKVYYESHGFKMVYEGDSHGTPSLFFQKDL